MDLNDLKKSVSDMSVEELIELQREMRQARRTPPTKAPAKRKASPTKAVEKALTQLTNAEIEKLKEMLQ